MSSRSRRCDIWPITRCWRTRNSTRSHVLLVDAQPPADRHRQPRADLAVRAAVRLADVVEQRPDRQRHRTGHLADRLARRSGTAVGVIAAPERVQPPHRVERVLVDGVDVIDVVLHAPGRRLPLGHQRGQQARGPASARGATGWPGRARRSRISTKRLPGLGVVAQRLAARRRQLAQHARACAAPAARPARSPPGRCGSSPTACSRTPSGPSAPAPPRARRSSSSAAPPASVEHRLGLAARVVARGRPLQEPLGLVANQLGVRVVLVHQRLDRRVNRRADDAAAIPRVGAENRRDRLLQREAQVILPAPGRRVHQRCARAAATPAPP